MNENKLPNGWEIKELGEVFDFVSTSSFSRDNLTDEKTVKEVYYIHYGDIHAKFNSELLDFNSAEVPFLKDEFYSDNFSFLKEGDLVIADASEDYEGIGASIEIKNINDKKAIGGLHTIVIRDNTNKTINGFRTYLFRNNKVHNELKKIATGISVYGISKGNLSKLKLPLPPLPEQKAIARVLSTADAAIHTTEKLIAQKELRKKWLMQQLLTGKKRLKGFGGDWQECQISDYLSRLVNGITYNTENTSGIPVTRIETISDGVINYSKIGFADFTDNIEDYRLIKGDILFSHINSLAHIGKVAIYCGEKPLFHGMNLLLLRCNEKINSNFLYQWLVSENGRKRARTLAKPAVNQSSISTTELRKISISLPSVKEQTAIAQVLQAADKEISLLKAKAEKLREQKKWLMQVLLTGEKRLINNNKTQKI